MLVVVIHPEQWNGGSDRCTLALLRHFVAGGHRVVWLTTMIDKYWKDYEFTGVEVVELGLPLHPGDWFSQNIAIGWYIATSNLNPNLVIADHSASCLPIIKWRFPQTKILFYCHFPQQLVTPDRFFLYRWYSHLIAFLEETMFEQADIIMVNSRFTASQFERVMPETASKIRVVYPPCDVDAITNGSMVPVSRKKRSANETYLFLSMNRFWPEKRLDIIVEAAAILKRKAVGFKVQLAGSIMPHIPESKLYYELLQKMTKDLDMEDVVEFIISPTEEEKFSLYSACDSVLYTPPNEHFGIVPIEALEQRRPVIVCDSGGPSETVSEDITGTKIATPSSDLLAEAMLHHIQKVDWPHLDDDHMYSAQRRRFEDLYSTRGFCANIDRAVSQLLPTQKNPAVAPLSRALA